MPSKPTAKSKKAVKKVKEKPKAAEETLKQAGLTLPEENEEPEVLTKAGEEDVKKEGEDEKNQKKEKYFQSVGRRKESVAIVRLFTKKSTDAVDGEHALIRVNDKDYREYFSDKILQSIVESPLKKLRSVNRFKATVRVNGGGLSGQADAIKHGLSRTLVLFDQNFRKKLKKARFLTRDSRVKERRKYGLKKARKGPAWSKR